MAVIAIDMSRDTQIREKARLREKALHDEVFYKGAEDLKSCNKTVPNV